MTTVIVVPFLSSFRFIVTRQKSCCLSLPFLGMSRNARISALYNTFGAKTCESDNLRLSGAGIQKSNRRLVESPAAGLARIDEKAAEVVALNSRLVSVAEDGNVPVVGLAAE